MDHLYVPEERAQAVEMVNCVAQREPYRVAQLVGVCPGVVGVERAAGRWATGTGGARVHPAKPGIDLDEFAEQFLEVLALRFVHTVTVRLSADIRLGDAC